MGVDLWTLSRDYIKKLRERRAGAPPPVIEDVYLTAEIAFRDGFRMGVSATKAGMIYADGERCRVCDDICELGPIGICIKCASQTS